MKAYFRRFSSLTGKFSMEDDLMGELTMEELKEAFR
jgi:hypothetical protein